MKALVIEGKKKSDYAIFIAMAKKLGLKAHIIGQDSYELPNDETIQEMLAAEKGDVNSYKTASDMIASLKKKTKNA